jgi:transcriptional regulator with GAF, ATPase, and Fis domain
MDNTERDRESLERENGVKSDAAALLDMNADNLLYRVKQARKKYPDMVYEFPWICSKYKITKQD